MKEKLHKACGISNNLILDLGRSNLLLNRRQHG
jgi:hypothetical protein